MSLWFRDTGFFFKPAPKGIEILLLAAQWFTPGDEPPVAVLHLGIAYSYQSTGGQIIGGEY
jgi:hypothetical protein